MVIKSHRLFIGNIPAGTKEAELRAEFTAYGTVEAIEIKTKANPLNESIDTFGFITLQTDDYVVPQCIQEFKTQKYKGVYLNVSKAKESFLDKLKREREEAESQKKNTSLSNFDKKSAEKSSQNENKSLPALPTLWNKNDDDSSESSESESEHDLPATDNKQNTNFSQDSRRGQLQLAKSESEIVKKWNQETYIEYGKLKIVPITGKVAEIIDRTKCYQNRIEGKSLGENARIADEKRKQGLNKLKSVYEQQKLAIKNALAGELPNDKRKITFDNEDTQEEETNKLVLFDAQEEDDDFEGNFTMRKQLGGEAGQKLFEMQTTYQADNRFRLDARFLESNQNMNEPPNPQSKMKDKERRKQLEILSNVTGKPIIAERNVDSKNTSQMQRFDPVQKEEIDNDPEPQKNTKLPNNKKAERREIDYKVSEQKFYTVSDTFTMKVGKQESSQGFSLISMFGKTPENNVHNKKQENTTEKPLGDKPFKSDARFQYESSDSEDGDSSDKRKKQNNLNCKTADDRNARGGKKARTENVEQKSSGYYSKQGIWKETFFFLPKDSRFDAGRMFLGFGVAIENEEKSNETEKTTISLTVNDVHDIRKLYKKRRYRESRLVQKKTKIGIARINRKPRMK